MLLQDMEPRDTTAPATQLPAATPPVNVYEGNGEIAVAAPIPGSHPQHTRVTVTPERVRIEADCKYPQVSQHSHRHEWQVGAWRLDVELPKRVDPARARASLNLGVLMVMAPMSESGSGESTPPIA
jgi:HSP20 family molecular chaperone IbpA